MGVIIAILGALAGVVVLVWRLSILFRAGQETVEVANDLRLAARRHGWRRKQGKRPIEGVEDPQLAAATILLMILRTEEPVDESLKARLGQTLCDVFGCDRQTGQDLVSEAVFVTHELQDDRGWIGKLARNALAPCSPEEKQDIPHMLNSVSAKPLSDTQANLVRHFRENAGLR